jgi:cyanate permease
MVGRGENVFDASVLEVVRLLWAVLAFLTALIWLWKELRGRRGQRRRGRQWR